MWQTKICWPETMWWRYLGYKVHPDEDEPNLSEKQKKEMRMHLEKCKRCQIVLRKIEWRIKKLKQLYAKIYGEGEIDPDPFRPVLAEDDDLWKIENRMFDWRYFAIAKRN